MSDIDRQVNTLRSAEQRRVEIARWEARFAGRVQATAPIRELESPHMDLVHEFTGRLRMRAAEAERINPATLADTAEDWLVRGPDGNLYLGQVVDPRQLSKPSNPNSLLDRKRLSRREAAAVDRGNALMRAEGWPALKAGLLAPHGRDDYGYVDVGWIACGDDLFADPWSRAEWGSREQFAQECARALHRLESA